MKIDIEIYCVQHSVLSLRNTTEFHGEFSILLKEWGFRVAQWV